MDPENILPHDDARKTPRMSKAWSMWILSMYYPNFQTDTEDILPQDRVQMDSEHLLHQEGTKIDIKDILPQDLAQIISKYILA